MLAAPSNRLAGRATRKGCSLERLPIRPLLPCLEGGSKLAGDQARRGGNGGGAEAHSIILALRTWLPPAWTTYSITFSLPSSALTSLNLYRPS